MDEAVREVASCRYLGQPGDARKPCDVGGRWDRYALREDDRGKRIKVVDFVVGPHAPADRGTECFSMDVTVIFLVKRYRMKAFIFFHSISSY